MDLDRFLRALVSRSYLIVGLIVVGLAGTFVYFQTIATSAVVTTVSVLEVAAVHSTGGTPQAQVSFANIAGSRTVAERVAQRLNLNVDPKSLQDKVTVKLSRTLVPSVTIPMYEVTVSDRDIQFATTLSRAVVDESTKLFVQLNSLTQDQVNAAVQTEETRLKSDADQAQADLLTFETANHAWRLQSQIDAQQNLVTSLRQSARFSAAGSPSVQASRDDVSDALTAAQQERDRLQQLQPQYDQLTFDLNLATSLVGQLTSRVNDVQLLNDPTSLSMVQTQLRTAQTRLSASRQAMAAFQSDNGVTDLNQDIARSQGTVADLQRQQLTAATPEANLSSVVSSEQTELDRMQQLLPQFDQLNARVAQTQAYYANLQERKLDMLLSSLVPDDSQVKVLDPAHYEPDTLMRIILYALSVLLATIVGVVLIYVLAYFDRTPHSVNDIHALFGSDVRVIRLPRAV